MCLYFSDESDLILHYLKDCNKVCSFWSTVSAFGNEKFLPDIVLKGENLNPSFGGMGFPISTPEQCQAGNHLLNFILIRPLNHFWK